MLQHAALFGFRVDQYSRLTRLSRTSGEQSGYFLQ
jgi:hypothetical protein